MSTILRATLPLVELPSETERYVMLEVDDGPGNSETIGTVIARDGDVSFDQAAAESTEARARGDVDAWLQVLLDGSLDGIDGAADATVDALLSRLSAAPVAKFTPDVRCPRHRRLSRGPAFGA